MPLPSLSPSSPLTLRALTVYPDDHDLFFLYDTRRNPEVSRNLLGEPPQNYTTHCRYIREASRKGKLFYLFETKGVRVGYGQISPTYTGKTRMHPALELGWVIAPEFQGKGHGKAAIDLLVAQAQSFADESVVIRLEVLESNAKARALYERAGFFESARRFVFTPLRVEDVLISMEFKNEKRGASGE